MYLKKPAQKGDVLSCMYVIGALIAIVNGDIFIFFILAIISIILNILTNN